MGLFGLLSKRDKKKKEQEEEEFLHSFSGKRFEILDNQKILYFIGTLSVSEGSSAKISQVTDLSPEFEKEIAQREEAIKEAEAAREAEAAKQAEAEKQDNAAKQNKRGNSSAYDKGKKKEVPSFPVQLRRYDAESNKAIHLSCTISHTYGRVWQASDLVYQRSDNERAFFRHTANIPCQVTEIVPGSEGQPVMDTEGQSVMDADGQPVMDAEGQSVMDADGQPVNTADPPQWIILNISGGGLCIQSNVRYAMGAVLEVRFSLLETQPPFTMNCQILRVTELKKSDKVEYGCKFLEMNMMMEDNLVQAILEWQRVLQMQQGNAQ